MAEQNPEQRYQPWLEQAEGVYALARCKELLRGLLSGWPRRSRSALVFNAGSWDLIDTLWEAGFDVTGQENDPAFFEQIRERLGKRVNLVLSAPDHLPFDDCSFDYAVAAAAVPQFWERPEAVLQEIHRVACNGVILLFPNSWSLFGLECRLRKSAALCVSARPLLQSPRGLLRLTRTAFGKKKVAWASALLGPSRTWKEGGLCSSLNPLLFPLPVGAFAGLRIDFGPLYTGTPLLLRSPEHAAPVASAE